MSTADLAIILSSVVAVLLGLLAFLGRKMDATVDKHTVDIADIKTRLAVHDSEHIRAACRYPKE